MGYFYRPLVYSDQCVQKYLEKKCGEGVIAENVEQFSKSAFTILDTISDGKVVERTAWIIPALLCSMQYINDAEYLPRNRTPDTVKQL